MRRQGTVSVVVGSVGNAAAVLVVFSGCLYFFCLKVFREKWYTGESLVFNALACGRVSSA